MAKHYNWLNNQFLGKGRKHYHPPCQVVQFAQLSLSPLHASYLWNSRQSAKPNDLPQTLLMSTTDSNCWPIWHRFPQQGKKNTQYTVHTFSWLLLSSAAESLASGPQSGKAPFRSLHSPSSSHIYSYILDLGWAAGGGPVRVPVPPAAGEQGRSWLARDFPRTKYQYYLPDQVLLVFQ